MKLTAKHIAGYIFTTLAHLLIVAVTVYIIYVCSYNNTLTSWHTGLLTVGFATLMSEAIVSITPDNFITMKLNRKVRVTAHWALQVFALACIIAGLAVIIVTKEESNRPHFESNHAILGLVAIICSVIAGAGGVFALYSVELKRVVKPVVNKLLHNACGQIAFILGQVTLILGFYTRWFELNGSGLGQTLCTIAVAFIILLSLYSAINSIYDKIKILSKKRDLLKK